MNITEKYRPKSLDEVLGQPQVTKSLKSIIEEKKHSSFIFEGPSGTGKTTVARIVAKMLGASGMDIEEFDASTNSGVDDMRLLAERQCVFPMSGARVFIVDECQRLSKNAWDALLKSIESPPVSNYWIFCTTEISKVPATIKTRCLHYKFKAVTPVEMIPHLKSIRELEKFSISDELIEKIASSVGGSPRAAILRLEQVNGLSSEEVEALLSVEQGIPGGYELAKLLNDSAFNVSEVMSLLKTLKDENAEGIRQIVRAYFTTVLMNSPSKRWPKLVLAAFIQPCVEQNYVTDLVMKVVTLEKWRQAP